MKFTSTVAAAAFVATVAAQGLGDFPPCAVSCLTTGIAGTTCGLDIGCACKSTSFINSSVGCIKTSCTDPADVAKARAAAVKLCASQGVTITLPDSGDASSSSSAPAPSSTEAPSTSSAAPSSTEAPSTTSSVAAPSSYAAPTSATSSTSSAASSVSTTVSTVVSTTSAAPSYTSAAGNSTSGVPVPPANNGASGILASGALAAVGVVAAFFF